MLDLEHLSASLGVPTCSHTLAEPDGAAMRGALGARFGDGEDRWARIERQWPRRVVTPGGERFLHCVGVDAEVAARTLDGMTLTGRQPEPLRLAHHLAAAATELLLDTGQGEGHETL